MLTMTIPSAAETGLFSLIALIRDPVSFEAAVKRFSDERQRCEQAQAELGAAQADLAARETALAEDEATVKRTDADVVVRADRLAKREAVVENRERDLAKAETALVDRVKQTGDEILAREQAVSARETQAEEAQKAAAALNDKASAIVSEYTEKLAKLRNIAG